MSDVTRILDRAQQGDPKAADDLLPLVYEELRKLAVVRMANEKPDGRLLVAVNAQGKAHFWRAPSLEDIAAAEPRRPSALPDR